MASISIHWFRQDLRLGDNPALCHAAASGEVLPIYILDDESPGHDAMGRASRIWLQHSLQELDQSLNGKLRLYRGNAKDVLLSLCREHQVTAVCWNRCYEPWATVRDTEIKTELKNLGIHASSHKAALLWEPWEVLKVDGAPYKVFTPYFRKGCLSKIGSIGTCLAEPAHMALASGDFGALNLQELQLLSGLSWETAMMDHWQVGEAAATTKLDQFLLEAVGDYKTGRDFPAQRTTSRLSPHLHFGEISPRQIWLACDRLELDDNVDHFRSEVAWREFSYYLLYHFPELPRRNFQNKFDDFPWSSDQASLQLWQLGQTGIPLVDAGMRELWQTGQMHNRVRMVVASFLVKNLLLDWRLGAAWFWDCLVDADLAANSASWQWVAGCGADAAPYFRIFNPVTQGKKFDPQGHYVRRYVPELAKLPDKYLHSPWEASDEVLQAAGVLLGSDYPKPLVDLKASRQRALDALAATKEMTANAPV